MPKSAIAIPGWLSYAELACATLAGAWWFVMPHIGPWPLLLALAPWVGRFILTGRLTKPTPYDPLLVLFLLTAALGVWAAYDRQAAWSKFWLIVGSVFLFYALANTRSLPVSVPVWLTTILGVVITFYFLATNDWELYAVKIEALNQLGRAVQSYLPRFPGPRLNPNEVGGIQALLLPFAGWGALRAWRRVRSSSGIVRTTRWLTLALAGAALAFMLFGLLLSVSRGAWLALGGVLVLLGSWVATRWLTRDRPDRRTRIFLGLSILLLMVGFGMGVLWLGKEGATSSALLSLDTWLSRLEFQRNSLMLVRDYPFIGAGLDGFQMLYSTYVLLIHVGFIPDNHNLYLSVAIDQGLPGLLALVCMWGLFAAIVWRVVRQPTTSRDRPGGVSPLAGIAAASLAIVLIHGVVENAVYGKGVLFLFVPLAFAVPIAQQGWKGSNQQRALSLLIVCMPFGLALLSPTRALSLVYSNLGAVHQGQAELSLYTWPDWPLQDQVRRAVDLGRPISEFERALSLNPRNATANRRLGMIELSLGEYEDALEHLQAAYAAEPNNMTTRQLLGEALIVNGHLDEGRALWSGVRNEQDQLTARVFWYQHIGDEERAEWVRQAASSH